jgi:2-polyprenyl-3-methyl-5-hydroxy-6-metoxy-1,4-benzoquinol methylase
VNSNELQESYDQVAEEYVARIFHELEQKPLDRELLNRFAVEVYSLGTVCDMGCGPGHIARHLHHQGVHVLGIDLSPRMVEHARLLNPGIEFQQGNMSSLDVNDEAWGGIVAFYSIIHIPREEVIQVLLEFRRVLRPGGLLLLSFHQGQETIHLDEWWGKKVSVDFVFFQRSDMENYIKTAGFDIQDSIERPPYEGVEVQTHRVYIFARKPH